MEQRKKAFIILSGLLFGRDSGGFYENQWEKYRYSRWVDDLRGHVLLSPESDEQLLRRMRDCYSEGIYMDDLD
jgi:hypothetical protein